MDKLIEVKHLTTLEDFENIKKWDFVACKFHRDIPYYETRFRIFEVYENKERTKEIILEIENNIYFNYEMFHKWESHLSNIILIK